MARRKKSGVPKGEKLRTEIGNRSRKLEMGLGSLGYGEGREEGVLEERNSGMR